MHQPFKITETYNRTLSAPHIHFLCKCIGHYAVSCWGGKYKKTHDIKLPKLHQNESKAVTMLLSATTLQQISHCLLKQRNNEIQFLRHERKERITERAREQMNEWITGDEEAMRKGEKRMYWSRQRRGEKRERERERERKGTTLTNQASSRACVVFG